MNREQKTCQNCKKEFTIEPEDFDFYKKINVPAPTWCPECRMMRRLMWVNFLSLYKRPCDAPGHTESIIAKYPLESKRKIYDAKYWWSDEWNPMDYGREYDFSKSFFEQFGTLAEEVPLKNLDITNSVNCDYCASAVECKNCYMCSGGYKAEDSVYSTLIISSKNCGESLQSIGSEFLYDCLDCKSCFRVAHAQQCENCMYSQFLYDCRNCEYCFGCVNLRNKKYCIFNEQCTKEEYEEKMRKMNIGSRKALEEYRKRWEELKLKLPRRFAFMSKSIDCTGDIIESSKNCKHCFWLSSGAENSKYAVEGGLGLKDSYDLYSTGGNSEMIYESVACGLGSKNVLFSSRIQQSHDVHYSFDCYGSSHLFGCISLRNKNYCIFNKQYSKEAYEALVSKIISHMNEVPYVDSTGKRYVFGEFFPPAIAPFSYNTSTAGELVPKTREEIAAFGFPFSDAKSQEYDVTMKSSALPDSVADTKDSILNEVIACAHAGECDHRCSRVFRIVQDELMLLREMNIPLPTLCPNCRSIMRMRQRNPLKLWRRTCMKEGCANEFETSYAPDRPEIVYCESCYQKEVV